MKSKLHPEKEKERSQAFDSSRSPKKSHKEKSTDKKQQKLLLS